MEASETPYRPVARLSLECLMGNSSDTSAPCRACTERPSDTRYLGFPTSDGVGYGGPARRFQFVQPGLARFVHRDDRICALYQPMFQYISRREYSCTLLASCRSTLVLFGRRLCPGSH